MMLMMPMLLLMMMMVMITRWIWNPQSQKFTDEGIYMLHEHVNGDFTRSFIINLIVSLKEVGLS